MISKKNLRNIFLGAAVVLTAAALLIVTIRSLSDSKDPYKYNSNFFSMDTVVSVRSTEDISKDIEEIFEEYRLALDCNDSSCETYKLNFQKSIEGSDILIDVINDTKALKDTYGSLTDITLGRLIDLWDITGKNPRVPSDSDIDYALSTAGYENIVLSGNTISLEKETILNFGAVGKGAALDGCLEYLKNNGCGKTCISTGSSLLLYNGDDFSVDIASPEGGVIARVNPDEIFLSTSGGYERYFEADGKTYCHILDPETGRPVETDLETVTVFCDNGLESDFLSTSIFIEGSENIEKYLNSKDFKIFAADKNKKLYVSPGLEYEVTDESYKE